MSKSVSTHGTLQLSYHKVSLSANYNVTFDN